MVTTHVVFQAGRKAGEAVAQELHAEQAGLQKLDLKAKDRANSYFPRLLDLALLADLQARREAEEAVAQKLHAEQEEAQRVDKEAKGLQETLARKTKILPAEPEGSDPEALTIMVR